MRPTLVFVLPCLLAAAAWAAPEISDLPLPAKGGQVVVAKITPIGETDGYAIFLVQGDVLTVAVKDVRPTIGLNTTFHLFDPTGADVTPSTIKGQGERKATLTFTAPSTGLFVVTINGDPSNLAGSTGDYQATIKIKHPKIANGVFANPAGGAISMTFDTPADALLNLSASTKKGGFTLTDLKRPDGTSEPKFATALKAKSPKSASLSKFALTGGDGRYEIVGDYDAGSSVTIKLSLVRDEKKRTRRIAEEPRLDPSLPPFPTKGVPGTQIHVSGTDFDDIPIVDGQNHVIGHTYPTFAVGGIVIPADQVEHPNGSIFQFPAPAGLVPGQSYDLTVVNADRQGVVMTEAFFVVPPPAPTGFTIATAGPAGGRKLRILGSGFLKNDVAIFDGTIVQPVAGTVKDDRMDVVAPPHAPGDVTVKVRDEYGQIANVPVPFTYLNVGSNRIVSLEPPTLMATGGEQVVVKGEDFDGTTTVSFDGVVVPHALQSSTQLTFTSPQHADATVKLRVVDQYEQASSVDVRVKAFTNVTTDVVPAPITSANIADGWRGGRILAGDVNGDGAPDVVLLRPEAAFGNDVSRSRFRLLLNDGRGALSDVTASKTPSVTVDEDWRARDGVLVDIDADSDLDLAIVMDTPIAGGAQSSLRLLKNNGQGTFTDFTATGAPASTTYGDLNQGVAIAAARLDAGSSFDLVVLDANYFTDTEGNAYPGLRLLLNNGSGAFTRGGVLPAVATSDANQLQGNALAVADVNADGAPDIVISRTTPIADPVNAGQYLRTATLLQNNGSAAFTDVSATKLPVAADPEYLQGDRVYLADLSGDGAPELLVSSIIRVVSPVTSQLAATPTLRIFSNNGQGVFSPSSIAMPAADVDDQLQANALVVTDLNGDGASDILVVSSRAPNPGGRASRVLARTGSSFEIGSLGLPEPSLGDDLRGMDAVVTDLDGDGAPDILVTRDEGVETVRNTVALHGPLKDFKDATMDTIPGPVTSPGSNDGWRARRVLVGDVDGDFRPDLVLLRPEKALGADANRQRVRLLTANGQGGFFDQTATKIPPVSGDEDWRAKAGLLLDVEGDGDLDIVIVTDDLVSGGNRSSLRILLNSGLGNFSDGTLSNAPGITAYGDKNQGVGIAAARRDVVVGPDVKTLQDLVVVHTNYFTDTTSGTVHRPGTRVFVNDGSGVFARKQTALPAVDPTVGTQYQGDAVISGDVDGDGKADLVVTRSQPLVDPQNGSNYLSATSLLVGDGNAVFTDVSAAKLPAKSDPEYLQADRTAFVDVDHDGRPEILLASASRLLSRPSGTPAQTPALRLLANDGNGVFTTLPNAFSGAAGLDQLQADGVAIGDLYGTGEPAMFIVSATAPAGRGGRLLVRSGVSGWSSFPRALPDPPRSDDLRGSDVALADVDGDGDLDVVIVRNENDAVRNTLVLKSVRK